MSHFRRCEIKRRKKKEKHFQVFIFQTVVSCLEAGGGISLNGCAGGCDVIADLTDTEAEPPDEADCGGEVGGCREGSAG